MESMKEKLTEYAQLLVRVGLNIQRGQPLVISSPVECAFFARLCAAEAYQAGCREVVMNWGDDELGRMKYLHAADEVFDTVPLWRRHFYNDYALEGAAYLAISASDPENLKGVDHSRIVRAQREGLEGLRPSPDVRRLPLVHRLHPHPQLGEEGVPGSCGERGNGQTVGGHLPGSAHYR